MRFRAGTIWMRNHMAKPKRGRSTAAIDDHVGARIRERRIMLGLTQQQLAEMIGVTYQQAHKYERGINRVSAGRLFEIARVERADHLFLRRYRGRRSAAAYAAPAYADRDRPQLYRDQKRKASRGGEPASPGVGEQVT